MKQYVINLNQYNVRLRGKKVFALECVSDTSLLGCLLYRLGRPRMVIEYLDEHGLRRRERVDKRLITPVSIDLPGLSPLGAV